MPRHERSVVPGLPHHAMLRGNNRRRLFSYPSEYRLFLHYLRKALEKTSCQLHAVCLMANHVHLLIKPPETDALSKCIALLAQSYAQRRNQRRGGTGKLFEQRFVSRPIASAEQMAVTTAYVGVNAWRAGLVSDPMAYRWSSFPIHAGRQDLGGIPAGLLTLSDWYLSLGEDPGTRARRYVEMVGRFYMQGIVPETDIDLAAIEKRCIAAYGRRLERPDRTRAA